MPSKNQRAASRQAKVRNKRKKGRAAPQDFKPAPAQTQQPDEQEEVSSAVGTTGQAALDTSSFGPAPLGAQRHSRRPKRSREPDLALYPYLKPELIRIGVISSIIFVMIGIMTLLLGG